MVLIDGVVLKVAIEISPFNVFVYASIGQVNPAYKDILCPPQNPASLREINRKKWLDVSDQSRQ